MKNLLIRLFWLVFAILAIAAFTISIILALVVFLFTGRKADPGALLDRIALLENRLFPGTRIFYNEFLHSKP